MSTCPATRDSRDALTLLAFVFLSASGSHGETCLTWRMEGPPTPRIFHAMAYDSARRVTVLRGGAYGGKETWEWDGATWSFRTSEGPSQTHVMAYDSARAVTVLLASVSGVRQTWEWDGTAWTQRLTPTQPAGVGPFAYDSARGVTVLYANQTWEYDGTDWTDRALAGPPSNHGAMVFDSIRNVSVLVGGLGTWEYDGNAWAQKHTGSADGHALAFDSARGVTVRHGSWDLFDFAETLEWDGTTWSYAGGGILPKGVAAMAFDSARNVTVLFGGRDYGSELGQTWEFDGTTWTLAEDAPRPRAEHAMAYDTARNVAVLFGGGTRDFDWYEVLWPDTWERSAAGWTLVAPTSTPVRPSIRKGHKMSYDSTRGVSVLHGGYRDYPDIVVYGDTWEWDGSAWVEATTTGPPVRADHGQCYDQNRGVTVVFGGWWRDQLFYHYLADTWEWDGTAWNERTVSGPSARSDPAMAYDPSRGVTVLYGGSGLGDTWEWNGNAWLLRTTQGPAPRSNQEMAYDPDRGRIVMVGPYNGVSETWDWDGAVWHFQSRAEISQRTGHALYYDAEAERLVLYGGDIGNGNNDRYGDTWVAESLPISFPTIGAVAEEYPPCSGAAYAPKNRYLSFVPPAVPVGAGGVALRVTLGPMPGPANCPRVADYSAFDGIPMWVGSEVLEGATPTGLFKLAATPLFRDWTTVPGGVVHVADCNIVLCAAYTVESISDLDYPAGPYSPALVVTTATAWGDLAGAANTNLPDGIVNFLDIGASVDCFRSAPGAISRTRADLGQNQPTQGANLAINFIDISLVVAAFRGENYPFSGPAAPATCP